MLGYIYQCEYALYHLLDRDTAATQISIETADDVVVDGGAGDPQVLLQLKLHGQHDGRPPRSLTDRHEDLWKTLRVWASQIQLGRLDPAETSFVLMTTAPQSGDKNSFAYLLAPKGADLKRDPATALLRLEEMALEIDRDADLSEKSSLKKGSAAFLLLSPDKRIHLVKNLTIMTSSPSISNLRKKIDRRLRASGGTDEVHPQFVEGVVGWWYGACIRHLVGHGAEPIRFEALEQKIAELSRALALSGLPRYAMADQLDDDEIDTLTKRTFVQQILAIGHRHGGELMASAMLDFYKADAHRKRWLEELRIDHAELSSFEGDLRGVWGLHFGSAEADYEDCERATEPAKAYERLGQRVLKDTLSMPALGPKGFNVPFMARGSYHILANGSWPSIGWHPQWKSRFRTQEPSE